MSEENSLHPGHRALDPLDSHSATRHLTDISVKDLTGLYIQVRKIWHSRGSGCYVHGLRGCEPHGLACRFFRTSVCVHETTRCHIPADCDPRNMSCRRL